MLALNVEGSKTKRRRRGWYMCGENGQQREQQKQVGSLASLKNRQWWGGRGLERGGGDMRGSTALEGEPFRWCWKASWAARKGGGKRTPPQARPTSFRLRSYSLAPLASLLASSDSVFSSAESPTESNHRDDLSLSHDQ